MHKAQQPRKKLSSRNELSRDELAEHVQRLATDQLDAIESLMDVLRIMNLTMPQDAELLFEVVKGRIEETVADLSR